MQYWATEYFEKIAAKKDWGPMQEPRPANALPISKAQEMAGRAHADASHPSTKDPYPLQRSPGLSFKGSRSPGPFETAGPVMRQRLKNT